MLGGKFFSPISLGNFLNIKITVKCRTLTSVTSKLKILLISPCFFHFSLRSKRFRGAFHRFEAFFALWNARKLERAQKSARRGRGREERKHLPANPMILKNPFVHERSFLTGAAW